MIIFIMSFYCVCLLELTAPNRIFRAWGEMAEENYHPKDAYDQNAYFAG